MSDEDETTDDAGDAFEGPSETRLTLAGSEITLTLADAGALRVALIAHLEASTIPERDYLLRMLKEVPGWIDEDGILRIGAWYLQALRGALVLTNRLPHGETAGGIYNATVERTSTGWKVTKLDFERAQYRS